MMYKNIFIRISSLFFLSILAFGVSAKTYIDVLFYYTNAAKHAYGDGMDTRISHLLNTTNKIHSDSESDIEFRLAHAMPISIPARTTTLTDVLEAVANQEVKSGEVNRRKYGADIVAILATGLNGCGVAYLNGVNSRDERVAGDISTYSKRMYSAIGLACGGYVASHEFGHLLGITHSRVQPGAGIFPHAAGHGEASNFATIMEYTSARTALGSGAQWPAKLMFFSNPRIYKCNGRPCGITQDDPVKGADAVSAMAITSGPVADLYPSTLGDTGASGNGREIAQAKYEEALRALSQAEDQRDSLQERVNSAFKILSDIINRYQQGLIGAGALDASWGPVHKKLLQDLDAIKKVKENCVKGKIVVDAAKKTLDQINING